MTIPTWEECHARGMTRSQAAKARGVTYEAARKWEWRTAERFASGIDRRSFRADHLAEEARLARTLNWASRHGLCARDLSRIVGKAENNVAKHAKRHGISLKRAYGTWHTRKSGARIMSALRRSFADPDVPPEAQVLLRRLINGDT